MNKDLIVWRDPSTVGTSIGTALELFKDCDYRFYANDGKRLNYQFTNKDGKTAVVILSASLQEEYEAGTLDKASVLKLPIYRVDKNADGEPLTDDKGNPITLMVFGKSQSGAHGKVKDLKAEKIAEYKPVTEHSFDEYC